MMISYKSIMPHQVWFSFILVFFIIKQGLCEDEYRAGFSAEAESCPDVDNKNVNLDVQLAPLESDDEDGPPLMALQGTLGLGIKLDSEHMMSIDIVKETDTGSEVMWKVSMPICDALKDDDAPWKPIFQSMGIESCPIDAKDYKVENMQVDLSFANDFLNHNYVGVYTVKVKMEDQQKNTQSCHVLGVSIVEV